MWCAEVELGGGLEERLCYPEEQVYDKDWQR